MRGRAYELRLSRLAARRYPIQKTGKVDPFDLAPEGDFIQPQQVIARQPRANPADLLGGGPAYKVLGKGFSEYAGRERIPSRGPYPGSLRPNTDKSTYDVLPIIGGDGTDGPPTDSTGRIRPYKLGLS